MKPIVKVKNKKNKFSLFISFVVVLLIVLSAALSIKWNKESRNSVAKLVIDSSIQVPAASQQSGFYNTAFTIQLSNTNPSTKIYYTTDGTKPDAKSEVYSKPIVIQNKTKELNSLSSIPTSPRWKPPIGEVFKGTTLRAIAVNDDNKCSSELVCTYFINENTAKPYSFPVVAITINPEDFFGYKNGIYVLGKNFEDKSDYIRKNIPLDLPWWEYPSNYLKRGDNSERPAHIQYFNTDGKTAFSEYVGIRINGNATRGFAQKSLRICFDKKYGNETLNYQLFKNYPISTFNNFILRNSGNDWDKTMFRDMFMQSLIANKNIDLQQYQPVIVFINGEYWGIHDMCERYDENYISNKYVVDKDSIAILEGAGTVSYGKKKDAEEFKNLLHFIQTSDLSNPQNYEFVKDKMSIDNFITNIIANIYFANSDWPNNNVKFWKYRKPTNAIDSNGIRDGKYRWMLYDTDWGFGYSSPNSYTFNLIERTTSIGSIGTIFSKLIKNESFEKQFLQIFQLMLNTEFSNEVVAKKINYFEKLFSPEIEEHINRWRVIGSKEKWKDFIKELEIFSNKRPEIQAKQLNDYFGLKEINQIRIK